MNTEVKQLRSSSWSSILTRRKKEDPSGKTDKPKLARVLGLLELTALGVGATLGLGVYVLAGEVAVHDAGPAVTISFSIAAIASAFAGLCYAEFASRVPRAGSAYVYCYVTVGEFYAFIIGWNLILEYAIGTASVAKGMSNYLDTLFDQAMAKAFKILMAWGVKESSTVNGIFTIVNLFTVATVIVCGLFKANPSLWSIPKENIPRDVKGGEGGFLPFGWAGVMAGAAKCFFGFVGFDVIATTGEEAKNPKKNIPLAIVTSLLIIFLAYFGIASVITMIIPYYAQNDKAPLPYAFKEAGLTTVMWIVTIGATCALSASMLGSIFPLPRILYAMAEDGMLFKCLSKINDKTQTPVLATVLSGLLTGIVAGIFNLTQLIDMMSIGTLLAYTIVAICILILRYEEETESAKLSSALFQNGVQKTTNNLIVQSFKATFNLTASKYPSRITQKIAKRAIYAFCIFISLFCFSFIYAGNFIHNDNFCLYLNIILAVLAVLSYVIMARQPQTETVIPFKVPAVPLVPCCSIMMNIYLMLKLDINTWVRFVLWLAIGLVIYIFYSVSHSVQGKQDELTKQHQNHIKKEDTFAKK